MPAVGPSLPDIQEGHAGHAGRSRVGGVGWREEATDHELEELRRANFDLRLQLNDQSEELRRLRAMDRETHSLQMELQDVSDALETKKRQLQKG